MRRYFRTLTRDAASFQPQLTGWYDRMHWHVDWEGAGNLSWRARRAHLAALFATYERLLKQLDRGSEPHQCWVFIDPADSSYDAVYLHTKNPNRDNFPFDFEDVEWDVDVPERLRTFVGDSFQFGRTEADGTGFVIRRRPAARPSSATRGGSQIFGGKRGCVAAPHHESWRRRAATEHASVRRTRGGIQAVVCAVFSVPFAGFGVHNTGRPGNGPCGNHARPARLERIGTKGTALANSYLRRHPMSKALHTLRIGLFALGITTSLGFGFAQAWASPPQSSDSILACTKAWCDGICGAGLGTCRGDMCICA